ncbi:MULTISPECIES: hypothetical protein [Bacillus cereus group]|uniref:hypothetical protein n=1 Tax=Bacillus cereus group TaxID=86661 RepID=UPI0021579A1F
MAYQVEEKKWILYRHTSSLEIIKAVAVNLKYHSKTMISEDDKRDLLMKLKEMKCYDGRNPEAPLDSINHRINTLAYFMFGYKQIIKKQSRFMFSPLGSLFLKHIDDDAKLKKIFLTMLWAVQFPHPHGGNKDEDFKVFPFRIIFKLLTDKRLDCKLFSSEYAYIVAFIDKITEESYEEIVGRICDFRKLSEGQVIKLFKEREHVLVNAVYEWDYYCRKLFEDLGVISTIEGKRICQLNHGTSTKRNLNANAVTINKDVYGYCVKLLDSFPYYEQPLMLNDSERLKLDIIKEIYSFYPEILLEELGENQNDLQMKLLELPKLISQYANNNDGEEAYLFEDILTEGFNMFHNVEAQKIGGAGNTDIECLYLGSNTKFAVDAKSTKNKLSGINAGRLADHRGKIGAKYTIVVTPRYVPAVKRDIINTQIVIIMANTFSEFLYNCINSDLREIDYADFDEIIMSNLGKDVSKLISDLTIDKFSSVPS